MADRARAYEGRLRERQGITELAHRFVDTHGSTVLHGPFGGLTYPDRVLDQADAPIAKLLGTYECELHPIFEEIIAHPPATIIDLGAADGYYAIGLARSCPASSVVAFELARSGCDCCRLLAYANVARLDLRGKATGRGLRSLHLDDAFVICDIEGAEANVFDQATVNALRTATILIELHEQFAPGITNLLCERFAAHDATIIQAQPRRTDVPELAGFTDAERESAVSEFRGNQMSWAVFRPRI